MNVVLPPRRFVVSTVFPVYYWKPAFLLKKQAPAADEGMPDLALYDAPVPLLMFLRDSVRQQIREWRYVDFRTMMDENDIHDMP